MTTAVPGFLLPEPNAFGFFEVSDTLGGRFSFLGGGQFGRFEAVAPPLIVGGQFGLERLFEGGG